MILKCDWCDRGFIIFEHGIRKNCSGCTGATDERKRGSISFADFALSQSGTKIICDGEDGLKIMVNATRTKIKYVVEGESEGPQSVFNTDTDHKTFTSYQTSKTSVKSSDSWSFFFGVVQPSF